VYIHGYNVSFEEAVIRAAQMGYDLKVEGVTALFSVCEEIQATIFDAGFLSFLVMNPSREV
jgi:hypothetical protein